MKSRLLSPLHWAAFILLLLPLTGAAGADVAGEETALDRYVAERDEVYGWELHSTIEGEKHRAHVLELTSQAWLTDAEIDRSVWTHWLVVIRPDEVKTQTALLYITGGANSDPAPAEVPEPWARMAMETRSVVAILGMVPNQPLYFTDTPDKARYEDDLIAKGLVKFVESQDPKWIVRLAMVKSGVRAMDAVQEFLHTDIGGHVHVEDFVVTGGSKRGWTTWLVGVVDERVAAMMPLVIDVLNPDAATRHHYEALGYFSPALRDYVNHRIIPDLTGSEELRAVRTIEDPYSYRNRPRMKIPKFIINAAGDEFFLPDNSQFYYGDLPEEKRLRYVPNVKHNLSGGDADQSMIAFYQTILAGTPRPRYAWQRRDDGALVVTTPDRPREVNLWQATNPDARDFRLDTIGPAYQRTPLAPGADGTYVAKVESPPTGFTAYFVELVFDGPGRYPFKFTTEVAITPDELPYDWSEALERAAAASDDREALIRPREQSSE
jgi:PhoPQ-activated pathogenicity-related protein